MSAYLIYTTTPELKALGMAWTRERAEDMLLERRAREQAKREAAETDADRLVKVPREVYLHAKIAEIEMV